MKVSAKGDRSPSLSLWLQSVGGFFGWLLGLLAFGIVRRIALIVLLLFSCGLGGWIAVVLARTMPPDPDALEKPERVLGWLFRVIERDPVERHFADVFANGTGVAFLCALAVPLMFFGVKGLRAFAFRAAILIVGSCATVAAILTFNREWHVASEWWSTVASPVPIVIATAGAYYLMELASHALAVSSDTGFNDAADVDISPGIDV